MNQYQLLLTLAGTFMLMVLLPMIYERMKLAKPCALSWEGWEFWHQNAKLNHPIRYFVTETAAGFVRYHHARFWDAIRYVRNSVWERYNVVVCVKLPPTWCDRDHLMLHACFQILTDFVEKEEPWEFSASKEAMLEAYADCDWKHERVEDWQELRELYQWWKQREETGEKYDADCLMLGRLIKHRRYLWT